MLNWNSKNVINLHFPKGAGGNFVACCLAFSPSVAPHDRKLSSMSLKEQQAKLIDRAKNQVFDFGCGVIEQYGVNIYDYQADLLRSLTYPPETVIASWSGQYILNITHDPLELEKCKILFTNSRTLVFQNFNLMISSRKKDYTLPRTHYDKKFRLIAGSNWQDLPYDDLEEWQQNEIKDNFSHFEYYCKNKFLLTEEKYSKDDCYLDTDRLLDKKLAMEEIKKVYDFFHLEQYNEILLSKFYDCWYR